MWNDKYKKELIKKRQEVLNGGGRKRLEKQHREGKLSARERLSILFDKDTFMEVDGLIESRISDFHMDEKWIPGDGVITGYGKINGRLVFAYSEDFTVIGGTLGEYHSLKICRIMDRALEMRSPLIAISDSGGARIEEGVSSLNGYSGMFLRNTNASGVIPQIAVIMGPCAGGACYSPAICDFIFMTESTSRMFITGPGVVKEVIGEIASSFELGSAEIHMKKSGVSHFVFKNDEECLNGVKKLLTYLPSNNEERPPAAVGSSSNISHALQEIVPDEQRKVYDVRKVIDAIVDLYSFLEVQAFYATNLVIGFGRLNGQVLGIVANQPLVMGGSLDGNCSEKGARFIRFCDAFNIPVLSLIDVPGFFPGTKQEHGGIIRKGAKLLYAYSEATVPKVSLIMRKAYGGAYIAMNSKNMGADMVYAWPIAQIAVMGAEGAADIIYRKEIENAKDSETARMEFIEQYKNNFMNPYLAAKRGYIDEVIMPEETRQKLIDAFDMCKTKCKNIVRKKHGNIPL
ncbi:acyl-CoA carboxylase subunit beta [Parablautia muri]|uniref:Acyl-CoA carboxylase subunit beta n=1 Tax=Parablautia muri TaxID=2320879 RepID=A0A9X5BFG3_9FIRM|nr:acyl-CoA carboxylase subunit beta [Parablautia muri]NBJ92672.1 acyl-CoA carboxylase subunit beta [Parablautia muri]